MKEKKYFIEKNQMINSANRWSFWKQHRDVIKGLVDKNIVNEISGKKNIIIFGAGECNDIDLKYYCSKFEEIILVDRDIYAMENALFIQNLSDLEKEKIKLESEIDFAGLDNEFYIDLENLLKSRRSVEEVHIFINNAINNINISDRLSKYREYFSAAISAAVHTQICIKSVELISDYRNNYSSDDLDLLFEDVQKLYMYATKAYNDLILSVLREDAYLFVLFDMMEISEKAGTVKYFPQIMDAINNQEITKLLNLINDKGTIGSMEGRSDLASRIVDMEAYSHSIKINFWIWPFSNEKLYYVEGITYNKRAFS